MANGIWHSPLGHPSKAVLNYLVSHHNLPLQGPLSHLFGQSCPLGKSRKLPFKLSNSIALSPLELIHLDAWTSPSLSFYGFRYYVLFIDAFSRYTWLYPLKLKSDVFATFVQFKTLVENMFNAKIKIVQTDGGGEYKNKKFQSFFHIHGIHHQFSGPHHPEQNGLAERKHRHLVETGLTLLAHASMPLPYWANSFAHSCASKCFSLSQVVS